MKKIELKKFIAAILIFVSSACEDVAFLDKVPLSVSTPENYYRNLSEFEIALTGCYETMNTQTVGGESVSWGTYQAGLPWILNGGTDELVTAPPRGGLDQDKFGIAEYLPVNSASGDLWKAFFAGIQRCNYLIDQAEAISLEDMDRQEDIVAEARFLRAFYYYHLAILFGGVPVNMSSEPQLSNPRASLQTVYEDLIIPDFEFAYNTLEDRAPVSGRANKWSAAGYLGVVYNYLASCKRNNVNENLNFELNSFTWVNEADMTQKAKTILKDVINNSGYQLIDRYDYLFRETTKTFQLEECLFTVEYDLDPSGYKADKAWRFSAGGNRNLYGASYKSLRPVTELYLSYNDALDIRRAHNITNHYKGDLKETIEGVSYYVPAPAVNETHGNNGAAKYRHMDPAERAWNPAQSGISLPLLRYADILLQYAEALYFSDDEVTARTYLTQVRNRIIADGSDVDDLDQAYFKTDFTEELLDERKRELCFEFKRRVDLIRFGKITEAINSLDPTQGANNTKVSDLQVNWADYKIWLPIPQRELDLNSNLIQNEGY